MPGIVQCRKGQLTERAGFACRFAVDKPVSQGLRAELLLAVPLQIAGKPVIADEIAYEVVCTRVHQHAHAALEERFDEQPARF